MSTDPKPSSLEDLCLGIANGERSQLPELLSRLAAERPRLFPLWPAERRDLWSEGLELILDSCDPARNLPAETEFIEALLAVGYDSQHLRDLATAIARNVFAAYADPAGLINALGIPQKRLPAAQVSRRWQAMRGLLTEKRCIHPIHGLGTVAEVDGLANQVLLQLHGKRPLSLEIALESLVFIRTDSPADALLRRQETIPAEMTAEQLRQRVAASFIPAVPCGDDLLRALIVPQVLHEGEFQALLSGARARNAAATTSPPPAAAKSTPATPPPAAAKGAPHGAERLWFQSRNLEELADITAKTKSLDLTPENLAAMRELFTRFGMKKEQAGSLAQAAGQLWTLAGSKPALQEFFHDSVTLTAPWQDKALFVTVTDELPGKSVPPWFEATIAACGLEWVCDAACGMPHRLFATLGKILAKIDDGPEEFLDAILARIQKMNPSADILLWLWKSKSPEREGMADPNLVFKTISKPVKGNYIKASKELRKLLMEDEDFQQFIMHSGDEDTVAALVSCIRHVPLLDNGEQQSLLVKIVRSYPDLRHLVEQRAPAKASLRPVDKITSIRSFELLRRELNNVISIQIPANSRAIGQARSFGDLRENAEFKAAKENQRLLRLRRNELERYLHEFRGFDFSAVVPAGVVIPGCTVTLHQADGHTVTHSLLGLRDGDPDRNFLSYDSPLGKALIGKKAGEAVEMPNGGTATVTAIGAIPAELHTWLRGEDLL